MFSESQTWLLLLADVSIKVLLLAIIAAVAITLLRIKNDHIRHRIWTAVTIGMLLMPVLVHVVPGLAIPIAGLGFWPEPQPEPIVANESESGDHSGQPVIAFEEASVSPAIELKATEPFPPAVVSEQPISGLAASQPAT